MSTALASVLQAEGCARGPGPKSFPQSPALACPTSPLVLAAVAGAGFALVLFALITVEVPYELIWMVVFQLAASNRRLLDTLRALVMPVAQYPRLLP